LAALFHHFFSKVRFLKGFFKPPEWTVSTKWRLMGYFLMGKFLRFLPCCREAEISKAAIRSFFNRLAIFYRGLFARAAESAG
jgi:hypothetical protein